MPQEPFNVLVDSIRTRVHAELDAQLPALVARHEDTLAAARQEAEAEARRRLQDALAAARRDLEAEAERRIREAAESARRDAEAEAERRVAALTPVPTPSRTPAILAGMILVDEAASISAMLKALSTVVSEYGASLFVGPELERWPIEPAAAADGPAALVRESFAAGRMLRRDGALASPLILDGTAIGVLHAASPADADVEAIDIITRYAAARLGLLTATRTLQARHWLETSPATGPAERSSERKTDPEQVTEDDDVQSARRYARLLVSEIKLYNETAVNEGRAHRDLSRRLGGEIDRARRLYEERVPSTIEDRARHFHHELIQTLAGGDPTLLG